MKTLRFYLIIWMSGVILSSQGQGDLLITPTRVVFQGNKQKEELNLVNVGNDTAVFAVSFVQYNMKEDGSFVEIVQPDSGQMFADPFLRVYPRRVTLAPREPQVIQLQFRKKSGMTDGEYRSHLYFRADKETKPLGDISETRDTTTLSVQLIPVFGLSIPVIIRTGNVSVNVELDNLVLQYQNDSLPILNFSILRKGNISVYGDLKAEYLPEKGNPAEIGLIKGVGVYTSIPKRLISLRLQPFAGKSQKGGKIRLTYYETMENTTVRNIAVKELPL